MYDNYDDYLRCIGELPDEREEQEAEKEEWEEILRDDQR